MAQSRCKTLPKNWDGNSGSGFLLSAMQLSCLSLGSKALPNYHLLELDLLLNIV